MLDIVGPVGSSGWFFENFPIYYPPFSNPLQNDMLLEQVLDLGVPSPGYTFQSINQLVFEDHR
jgi:hypothetical protein